MKRNKYVLSFNGQDSGVKLPSYYYVQDGSFTRSIWLKKIDNSRGIIFGGYDVDGVSQTNLEFTTDNEIRCYWDGSDFFFTPSVEINKWMNITWVRDKEKNEQRIYIDGELFYTHNNSGVDVFNTGGREWVGRDERTGTTVFKGEIYSLVDFKFVKTEEEIKDIIKDINQENSNAYGRWLFNEGVEDKTFNEIDEKSGQLNNVEWIKGEINLKESFFKIYYKSRWDEKSKSSEVILSNNNLTASFSGQNWSGVKGNDYKDTGRWYWEIEVINVDTSVTVGLGSRKTSLSLDVGSRDTDIRLYRGSGSNNAGGLIIGDTLVDYEGDLFNVGDVIGVAVDLYSGIGGYYKNGVYQGDAFDDLDKLDGVAPICTIYGNGVIEANFGDKPFKYKIPYGYRPYNYIYADWHLFKIFCLKEKNKLFSIKNNNINIIEVNNPTKKDYDKYGISKIENISSSIWEELLNQGDFELIFYTEEEGQTSLPIEVTSITEIDYPKKEEVEADKIEITAVTEVEYPEETEPLQVEYFLDNNVERDLVVTASPHPFIVFQENDLVLEDPIESFSFSIDQGEEDEVFFLVSPDGGSQWYTIQHNDWLSVDPAGLEQEEWLSQEEITSVSGSQWRSLLQEDKVRFAFMVISRTDEDIIFNEIRYETAGLSTVTPSLEGIDLTISELSIDGRLKELERLNKINLTKLNFKASALLESDQLRMHDMIVDTAEEEEMNTTESSASDEKEKAFSEPEEGEEGFISHVSVSSGRTIQGIKGGHSS